MRRKHTLVMALGISVSGAGLWAAGCSAPSETTSTGGDVGGGSATGGNPDGGISSSSGGGPPVMPSCKGDPTKDSSVIDEACGVFVRGGATDSDDGPDVGTPTKPFKTIQAAINKVTDKWIFVCNANTFNEALTISRDNVAIYGGFDCSNLDKWVRKGTPRSTIQGPQDTIAVKISGKGGKLEDFDIKAGKASKDGGSSIAVLVNAANPSFARCGLFADLAKAGAKGTDAPLTPAQAGVSGQTGGKACSKDTVPGAAQVKNTCSTGEESIGGNGGQGTAFNGSNGGPGQPLNGGGQAGQGEPSNDPTWTCATNNGNGKGGAKGLNGMGGPGASSAGSLTAEGFVPASGGDGTPGHPGQGGGGGGGVKGGTQCTSTTKGGASGGSGGSGGCGGQGGKGGQGAGASIALVSLASPDIKLTEVTLTAVDGALGGVGGNAQAGGSGAAGGAGGTSGGVFGIIDGCAGGAGGKGGDGGAGGGGLGGHSIGLAYTGTPPTINPMDIQVGKAGRGGDGGSNNFFNNKGDDGISNQIQPFMP